MKTSAIALIAAAGIAGVAQGQAFIDVQFDKTTVDLAAIGENGIVTVSVFLDRNGSSAGFLASFTGWSQFSGTMGTAEGSWLSPDETGLVGGLPQTNVDNNWMGRRAQQASFFDGGSAGGFRFPGSENYTISGGGSILGGDGASGEFEGIARSTALGGFLHDASPRLEVFRAQIDLSGLLNINGDMVGNARSIQVDFNALSASVFITDAGGDFNIERSVTSLLGGGSGSFNVVPAPASLALLGLGGIAAGRRRR